MVMDFVGDQERARSRTGLLVFLFILAVIGISALVYLVVAGILIAGNQNEDAPLGWWQPKVLLIAGGITVGVIGIGSLVKTIQLSSGGKAVAEALGGSLIHPDTRDPQLKKLLNVVEEMSIASGCPVPPVYLIDDPSINAFAAGFTVESAVIGVTTGCVQRLSRDELQGVMAHEFSHIVHGDMRLNIRLTGIIFGIMVIGFIGWITFRFIGPVLLSSRGGGKDNSGPAIGLAIMVVGIALMIIGGIGTFVARLIQAAVSRQREFLADAAAVDYTRNPSGIAGALRSIGGLPKNDLGQAAASQYEHFFFTPALSTVFATHPPLPERIARIENRPAEDVRTEADSRRGTTDAAPAAPVASAAAPASPPAPAAGIAGLAGIVGAAGAAAAPTNFSTRKASQVRESLSRFGDATPDHLAYARSLIANIPEAIRDAAHDVIGARAICLILLVSADEGVRKTQSDLLESSLDEPTRHEVSRLSQPTRRLLRDSPESRLVLLDLLMPALVRMRPEDAASYSKILTGMMDADGSRDRFEWLMGRLIQSHFESHTTKKRGQGSPKRRIGDLEVEVRLVLAMIAWSSGRDRKTAERSFRVSARAVDVGDADFPDRSDCSVAKLDQALDRLQRLRYRDRPRLLDAAVEGIFSDGHATIEEVELLRALAATLSCPMPPVLPG